MTVAEIPGVNTGASSRARKWLFTLAALGEMAVGVLIALFPAVGTLLIGALLDSAGLVVARMMGVALLSIGLTWWLARSDPACAARNAPGFILYNTGVGAVFLVAALSASQPLIPWILAVVHIAVGTTFGAAVAVSSRETTTARS